MLITANLVDLQGPADLGEGGLASRTARSSPRIGANHVIYPEREAGERVAHLVSGRMLDFIRFDDDFALVKMYPPKPIRGVGLNESGVRSKYNVTVVGVKSPGKPFTLRDRGEHGGVEPRPHHRVGHRTATSRGSRRSSSAAAVSPRVADRWPVRDPLGRFTKL